MASLLPFSLTIPRKRISELKQSVPSRRGLTAITTGSGGKLRLQSIIKIFILRVFL
jgi:hypothetical protein